MQYVKCKERLGKIRWNRLLRLITLVSAIFFSLSSCSTYRINRLKDKSYKEWKSYRWTEVKRSTHGDDTEWTIHSRKVKGTSFLEYRIAGEIPASPMVCISLFERDIWSRTNDPQSKKYPIYEVKKESVDSLLTYVVHNEPFPLKDTEMSVRYIFYRNEDGSTGVTWKEAWEHCSVAPSKKLSRVQNFRGSWNFIPLTQEKSSAVYSVQFDPKKMPLWLVRPMVHKFLKSGLQNLREMAVQP